MLNIKKFFIVFFLVFFSLFISANIAKAEERTFYAVSVQSSQCPQYTPLNSYTLEESDLIIIKGTGFGTTEDELAGPHACWSGQYIGGIFIKNGTTYKGISCQTFNVDNQPIGKSLVSWNDSEIRFYAPKNISNNDYINDSIRLRIYDTYHGGGSNCKTATLSLSPLCSAFTYSDWTSCSVGGSQTRTVLNSSPSGCSGGTPLLTQSCIPACTISDYSCGDWSSCVISGTQTRICNKTANCNGGIQMPLISQSCIYTPPVCDSWDYSDWSDCKTNGTQTRAIISTSPNDCVGGNPILAQSCNFIPLCTIEDYSCGNWSACSQTGTQNRTCSKIINCQGGVSSPDVKQSCKYTPACSLFYYSSWSECSQDGKQTRNITSKYPSNCEGGVSPQTTQFCTQPCSADTWTCDSWGECSLSGIQNRSCKKTFDCSSVETAPPITDQYCEAPNRPTLQTLPSGTDEILNQDTIIKSTVKLLCPINTQMASQGSGTVIDSSGIILTNKHVIAGTLGCLVGFIDDFNDEPYFGERQIADILKVSSNQDIAILKIRNPQNKKLASIDMTKGNSNLRLGTKITIYGYPAKFGTNITYTSGDFSGTDGSYLKTTAILEYGNSGGGAYLKDGTFIGIPSAVVKGELNALGYILSINTINSWLGNTSIVSGGTSNNQYSRVSILEDIDLKKLGALKLFIPDTDAKGDLSASTKNQSSQNIEEQPQSNQVQEESVIIEPNGKNKKINLEQDNLALPKNGNNSSVKILEQRRSIVANAVQEMVKVAERNGGVGQEIKVIAQTQTQNQEKLETGIQKIQSRSGFVKFFIGPNYGEIKNSQKLLEQSKKQTQELNQLRIQVVNQGDQLQIVEQIQLLEQANQQIETSLNETQKGFSLLGWIFRLFTK